MLNFPGVLPPTELQRQLEDDLAKVLTELCVLEAQARMLEDRQRLLRGLLKLAKEPPNQEPDYAI